APRASRWRPAPRRLKLAGPPRPRPVAPRDGPTPRDAIPSINMMTQLTIFKKGLTLIAVPLLVQAVFIAVLVRGQAEHDRAQERAVHTKDVIAKVEELHRSLVEGYAGARGLIFDIAPAGTGRHEAALRRLPAQLAELRELVSDNPNHGPRI